MCLLLALCWMLPNCCVHLLAEFPICSEKLGQWADEIWDAVGWDTLQAEEMLQGVFSRTLQTSGQNIYCCTEVLSAALNFDWEKQKKKQKHAFLYSPLLCHIRLCWELLPWEVSKWGIGGRSRGERKRKVPGESWDAVVVSLTLSEIQSVVEEIGMLEEWQSMQCERKEGTGVRFGPSRVKSSWAKESPRKEKAELWLLTSLDHPLRKQRCPAILSTMLPQWGNPDHV